jgi:hypothetical protein
VAEPWPVEEFQPALAQALFVLKGRGQVTPSHRVFRIASTEGVDALAPLLADSPEELVVLVDAGWPWRRGRRWRTGTHAVLLRVQELPLLRARTTTSIYLLWPSATQPAYLVPYDDRHGFTWLRRSGLLAGGHSRIVRFLVHRSAVDGLLWWACPAGLVVVSPR